MVSAKHWKCMKAREDYICCLNLKNWRCPSIDFHSFFRYLATESMSPKQFPVVLFAKAATSQNFDALKTGLLRIFFTMPWRPLKFAAFNFRSKDAEPFGSNKKYLNIETSPLFWTCLQFSSMLDVLYERGGSYTSVQLCHAFQVLGAGHIQDNPGRFV